MQWTLPYGPSESDSGLWCSISGPPPILLRRRLDGGVRPVAGAVGVQRYLLDAVFGAAVIAALESQSREYFH